MRHDPNLWHIDASGNAYAMKTPAEQRHPLLGPGIGDRRIDRLFDGIGTIIIAALGIALTVGMLKVVDSPSPTTPTRPDTVVGVCDK